MSIIEKVLDKLDDDQVAEKSPKKKEARENEQARVASDSAEVHKSAETETEVDTNVVHHREVELDFEKLSRLGILTPHTVNIKLTEQLRRIKSTILTNAFGKYSLGIENQNMVMVTSAIQNEGKSFTSLNLVMSIAKEFNHTVLYIDADVTKRNMEKLFSFKNQKGLVDYLLGDDKDLAEFLVKTNVPRLTLLPSGRPFDKVTELWSSERMNELMSELSQRYSNRLIVFDAPPLLQDSSASILARMVGQTLIIVEAEKTPKHLVDEAVAILDEQQYIGLILNKSNQRDTSEYGYYAYGEDPNDDK